MYLKSPYPQPPNLVPKNYFALTLDLIAQRPFPNHVLYIDALSGEQRTKTEFLERVHDAATALGASKEKGGLGLNKNHLVGILSDNCLDYPVLTLALLSIATPFSLYSSFATTHELHHYHGISKATHVFVQADLLERFLPVAKKNGLPEENIFILQNQNSQTKRFKDFNSLIDIVRSGKIPREPIRDVHPDDLAYLISLSRLIGQLKPVIGYNTLVLLPKWNKDVFIESITKYRVTNMIVIPSTVQQLLNDPKFQKADLSTVEGIGCAAAYLPPALATKLQARLNQSPLSEGCYGMSEATLAIIGRGQIPLQYLGLYDATSTGVLMPGMEGVLLRPDGTHCLTNETGDLYIKGPNVTLGYRDNPNSTKEVFLKGGWLRTGDRFRADERGVLWFEDRAKDTLKVSGLQVSPVEIEETILSEPTGIVGDVSVAGVQLSNARTSDDKVPRAWIVLTEKGKKLSESEAKERIESFVKERLSKYKWLRGGIKFVDTIPRNVTGIFYFLVTILGLKFNSIGVGKTLRRVLVGEYEAEQKAQAKFHFFEAMHIRSPYPDPPNVPYKNYFSFILDLVERFDLPDDVVHVDAVSGEERKRFESIERIRDTATALGIKIEQGGLGLHKDRHLDYAILSFGLLALATPFTLFSPFATPNELRYFYEKTKITHIFVDQSLLPRFLTVVEEIKFPKENIFIIRASVGGKNDVSLLRQFRTLDSLINAVKKYNIPREPIREVQPNDLAYLVFSSGTGGLPKAVMTSHAGLCATILQDAVFRMMYVKAFGKAPVAATSLNFVPMSHAMGLHLGCLKNLVNRIKGVIMPRWDVNLAIDCIPRYKVTTLYLVPSAMHALWNSPRLAETDLSSLNSLTVGAAHIPHALMDQIKKKVNDPILSEGYGMSEATLSLMLRLPSTLETLGLNDETATGVLVPGAEAILLRPDGTHCLPDEPGELYVKTPNAALGYWNDPESTKKVFLGNNWLRTGDRFRASSKGLFWFEDRVKDTLKVSGLQVSPAEIEQTIFAEPSRIVSDVSVAGVQLPTARTSDDRAPRAWIVLNSAGKALKQEEVKERINSWVQERLSKYKWLRGGIAIVDSIPRNPTGKALRRTLVEEYEAEVSNLSTSQHAKL
ncbi:hypothetical protein Clacol_010227 [Clathrus columnatus]|uniref:Acetyl-CoA synthetase-like protein n=1 Tax=Clathrus columnatus TaxID=1419009 RepID=A0AAV5AR11_9AGAM|nr:hypothetical protein Clacol_010227 [Clathrus columnatus]